MTTKRELVESLSLTYSKIDRSQRELERFQTDYVDAASGIESQGRVIAELQAAATALEAELGIPK